jgi:hypothetical protein
MIANCIYGGEWGAKHLGNTEPGDGWMCRGAGPLQGTGRDNFTRFAQRHRQDPARSARICPHARGRRSCSPAWFWEENDINRLADTPGVTDETRRINGGTLGLADRNRPLRSACGRAAARPARRHRHDALFALHQHAAHAALKKADQAGYQRAKDEDAKTLAQMRARAVKAEENATKITQQVRTKHDQEVQANAAAADAVRVRGPGAAGCRPVQHPAFPAAASVDGAGHRQADAAVAQVPSGEGESRTLRIALVAGAVALGKQDDDLIAEVPAWRDWYPLKVAEWDKLRKPIGELPDKPDAGRRQRTGRLNGLLASNSPYMQAAREAGIRAANARGLTSTARLRRQQRGGGDCRGCSHRVAGSAADRARNQAAMESWYQLRNTTTVQQLSDNAAWQRQSAQLTNALDLQGMSDTAPSRGCSHRATSRRPSRRCARTIRAHANADQRERLAHRQLYERVRRAVEEREPPGRSARRLHGRVPARHSVGAGPRQRALGRQSVTWPGHRRRERRARHWNAGHDRRLHRAVEV